MEKRSKFSHLFMVRAEVTDPPPYGQPDCNNPFFTSRLMISSKVKTPIETGSGSEKENSSDLVRSEKKRRREEEGSKEEKRRKKDELENGKGGEDLKPRKEKSREEKDRDREREKRREKERKEKREKERREGGEKREKTAEKEKDGKKEDRPPKPKDPKDAVKQHLSFKVGSNLSATYF